jgi:beta-mannosidase
MKRLTLSGDWSVKNERTSDVYSAAVPGFVQLSLMEQGILPKEYDTLLEEKIAWVEYDDWTYAHSFSLDPEVLNQDVVDLVFEGIDTYAEIRLNGQFIGRTENMWIPVRFNVKGIAAASNELEVRIASPTRTLQAKEKEFGEKLELWNGIPARLFGRKAQYGYGWDWGPRLVTVGIPKQVFIEAYEGVRCEKPGYTLSHVSKEKVYLQANVAIHNASGVEKSAEVTWRLFDGEQLIVECSEQQLLQPGSQKYITAMEISKPKLWYPIGYGEQPLYRLEITVVAESQSSVSECAVGIRTVRILQPYDKQGRKFVFEINGIPILCKGVNWIPLTLYPNIDTAEAYRSEIEGIVSANMNMIRIWGGGTYENHDFFEICDRLGVMVWQDFMFACGDYPDDDAFCTLVRIVLWCGNNENQHFVVRSKKHRKEGFGEKLYFEVLADATLNDTLRPYWPTSPYDLSVDSSENNADYGDMHYWHVWGQVNPYENYGEIDGRFLSEFGMQSYPSMRTLDTVDPHADLRDPKFDIIQKAPNGIQRLLYYTVGDYRLPVDKSGFVYVNQLMQANALRLAVEHWISRMPDTSGALIWQWSDLWPSISWSIVDYDKVRKPSYFYMKRSFQSPNAVAKLKSGSDEAAIYLVHEKGDFSGRISVEFYDVVSDSVIRTEMLEAIGQGYQSTYIGAVSVKGIDPTRTVALVHLYEGDQLLARNTYLLGKPYGLKLKPASIEVQQENAEEGTRFTVTTNTFTKDIWFQDIPGELSDNSFDLKAGESKVIHIAADSLTEGQAPKLICLNNLVLGSYL